MIINRKIYYTLIAALASAILVGCGGGGNTTPTGSTTTPFTTNAPSTLSLTVGQTVSYVATGGGDGNNYTTYSIADSNPSVDKVSISGANYTITALKAGTDTVNVSDAAGDKQSIAVTVTQNGGGTGSTVTVTAPQTVNLTQAQSVTYAVSSGTGIYSAVSGSPGIANAVINGNNTVTITTSSTKTGTAIIDVYDSTFTSPYAITVNVTAANTAASIITTAPSQLTLTAGVTASYPLFNGVPPYTVTSSIPSVVTTSVTSNIFTLDALTAGGPATIQITDAALNQTSIQVTVGPNGTFIPLNIAAPATITVGVGQSNTVSYQLIGGYPPYIVSTGSSAAATAKLSTPTTISFTGVTAGSTTQGIVFDSQGNSKTITINVATSGVVEPLVSSSGSAVTIAAGSSGTYTIQGGTPQYTVTSSNTGVATVQSSGSSYTVKGVASGSATIVILDSADTIYNVTVTVP